MVINIPVKYIVNETSFEIEKCDGCSIFLPIDDLEIIINPHVDFDITLACENCVEDFNLAQFILK